MLCAGYVGGTFDADNAYGDFVTAPQIYTPTAPLGQRWSGLLIDSGIDRGYHNSALLIASGEVGRILPACLSIHDSSQVSDILGSQSGAMRPGPSQSMWQSPSLIMLPL